MPDQPDPIGPLREALQSSPDNVTLQKHLADTLYGLRRYAEAEVEYLAALKLRNDADFKLALADCYFRQEKFSHAQVVLEELTQGGVGRPDHYLLQARLFLRMGDVQAAVDAYRTAVDGDPELAEPALANQLGIYEEVGDDADVVDGRIRQRTEDDGGIEGIELECPDTTFQDVGGMDDIKEEIRLKIIHPLNHPEIYEAYGKQVGGGVLMYGPPGCGKTHLARATAGEVNATFLAIGIHDVLDMWIGQSERNLHELFEMARAHTPCVLFFDEVDALGASRSDMRQSAGRQQINQFLAELDGIKSSNDGILILAATNAPWHLDSAFRRPGRFDRVVFVPPPDSVARADILRVMLAGKPLDNVDCRAIAKKTEGFSGADLKAVVDLAIEGKLAEALAAGVPAPLRTKDLVAAARKRQSTTREWFSTARNYALYSNQSGAYDDILKYLKITS